MVTVFTTYILNLPLLPLLDLTDSDTITELLRQAGGEGTLLHQSPDRDLPLTPADLHSVSIDLDEFESARAKSKSL